MPGIVVGAGRRAARRRSAPRRGATLAGAGARRAPAAAPPARGGEPAVRLCDRARSDRWARTIAYAARGARRGQGAARAAAAGAGAAARRRRSDRDAAGAALAPRLLEVGGARRRADRRRRRAPARAKHASPAMTGWRRSLAPRPERAPRAHARRRARAAHAARARRRGGCSTRRWPRRAPGTPAARAGWARRRSGCRRPAPRWSTRVNALDTALREGGFLREALRLRRTYLESVDDDGRASTALLALADEASDAGLARAGRELARRRGASVPLPPVAGEPTPTTPADHYLAAQRLLARRRGREAAIRRACWRCWRRRWPDTRAPTRRWRSPRSWSRAARDRRRGAGAPQATARSAARRARAPSTSRRGGRAWAGGWRPSWRRSATRSARWRCSSGRWPSRRRARARACAASARGCCASLGRPRELAAALEKDAGALLGDARLPVLAEQAELLEAAGEAERALDVRLMALAEFPGAPAVARRRARAPGGDGAPGRVAGAGDRRARSHDRSRAPAAAAARRRPAERAAGRRREPRRRRQRLAGGAGARAATDAAAAAAAERLLRRDRRLGALRGSARLAGGARGRARVPTPPTRGPTSVGLLWRLAELRRERLGQADEALRLYGQLAALGAAARRRWPIRPSWPRWCGAISRWRSRPRARGRARPPADRSRALVDRATLLLARGRGADAERDALAALDLDPRNTERARGAGAAVRGRAPRRASWPTSWAGAPRKLPPRAGGAAVLRARAAPPSAPGDRTRAREAYRARDVAGPDARRAASPRWARWRRAKATGPRSRRCSRARSAWRPVAEAQGAAADRAGGRLRRSAGRSGARGGAARDRGAPTSPTTRACSISARASTSLAGNWQAAADALDRLAARGATIADAAERYFAVAAAAEAAGQHDRALTLYSRSYGRDSGYRPTLERLAAICFDRGQWDNAWKATEALLERHGAALAPGDRATLLARSAIADLHIGQRAAAIARLKTIVTRGASYVPDAGIRDVAESWAGMHLEPRLLVDVEPAPARSACSARASEVLALVEDERDPVRGQALEMVGALASRRAAGATPSRRWRRCPPTRLSTRNAARIS